MYFKDLLPGPLIYYKLTMTDKLMYIFNVKTQNYSFYKIQIVVKKRSDTQLNKATNQNSLKVPKVVGPTNKKTLL